MRLLHFAAALTFMGPAHDSLTPGIFMGEITSENTVMSCVGRCAVIRGVFDT